MYNVDNKKIGAYLKRIIEKKFISHRQFCRKYLEAVGVEADNEELRKMGNRLSQILKGTKGVQIYDLPVFTELLGVSCEEILSQAKAVMFFIIVTAIAVIQLLATRSKEVEQ